VAAARTRAASALLGPAFAEGRCSKVYLACVAGGPAGDVPAAWGAGAGLASLDLDFDRWTPYAADPPGNGWAALDTPLSGKPALTHVRAVARAAGGAALLELRPATGRTRQLRRHLAAAGHPILGDEADPAAPRTEGGAPAIALWAVRLTVPTVVPGAEPVVATLPGGVPQMLRLSLAASRLVRWEGGEVPADVRSAWNTRREGREAD